MFFPANTYNLQLSITFLKMLLQFAIDILKLRGFGAVVVSFYKRLVINRLEVQHDCDLMMMAGWFTF